MTTYSAAAVSDTVIAYKKSITLQVGRALRDNPLAMFEGAAGAPRLQFAAMDTWYSTPGQVGTYVFARYTGGADKTLGGSVAGSDLVATSAAKTVNLSGAAGSDTLDSVAALSGTWKCAGYFDDVTPGGAVALSGATLWIRVA